MRLLLVYHAVLTFAALSITSPTNHYRDQALSAESSQVADEATNGGAVDSTATNLGATYTGARLEDGRDQVANDTMVDSGIKKSGKGGKGGNGGSTSTSGMSLVRPKSFVLYLLAGSLTATMTSLVIEPPQRLRRAVHGNDALLVKRILNSHPDLIHNPDHSSTGLSNSNLHLAASLGHMQVCKVLIALGHEVPTPALNDNHQTALMLAAAGGHTEVVHFLAENDPSAILRRDIRGRDAIMEASLGGHDTVLQILLTYVPGGAESAVKNADMDGNTALHFASSNGHLLVLRTLLAAGADADKKNVWSWSAVAYSATVQAEVYFKNLVADVEKRRRVKHEVQDGRESRKVGGLRIVEQETSAPG
ncbi:ankyrin repeat-containing domain protein [Xylariaceae sp. FL1651]|nr:ankyrin repeat-containing domain protein [Xylariaceae sp. FL1651]